MVGCSKLVVTAALKRNRRSLLTLARRQLMTAPKCELAARRRHTANLPSSARRKVAAHRVFLAMKVAMKRITVMIHQLDPGKLVK